MTGAQAILNSARVPLGTVIDVTCPPGEVVAVGSGAAELDGCCAIAGKAPPRIASRANAAAAAFTLTLETLICTRLPSFSWILLPSVLLRDLRGRLRERRVIVCELLEHGARRVVKEIVAAGFVGGLLHEPDAHPGVDRDLKVLTQSFRSSPCEITVGICQRSCEELRRSIAAYASPAWTLLGSISVPASLPFRKPWSGRSFALSSANGSLFAMRRWMSESFAFGGGGPASGFVLVEGVFSGGDDLLLGRRPLPRDETVGELLRVERLSELEQVRPDHGLGHEAAAPRRSGAGK